MAALRAASSRAFLASSLSAEASAGVSQPLYACTNRSRQPALERLPPRPSDRASVRADAWPPHRPAATTSSSCGDTVPRRHRARRPGEQSAAPVGRASTAKTRARRASTVGGGTQGKHGRWRHAPQAACASAPFRRPPAAPARHRPRPHAVHRQQATRVPGRREPSPRPLPRCLPALGGRYRHLAAPERRPPAPPQRAQHTHAVPRDQRQRERERERERERGEDQGHVGLGLGAHVVAVAAEGSLVGLALLCSSQASSDTAAGRRAPRGASAASRACPAGKRRAAGVGSARDPNRRGGGRLGGPWRACWLPAPCARR